MKKIVLFVCVSAMLAACSSTGSGNTEMYGEIKSGVETTRHF